MSIEFQIDSNEIEATIERIARQLPEINRRAKLRTGLALAQDAVNQSPTPPVATGYLRGSWFVAIENKSVETGKTGHKGSVPTGPDIIVGFSAAYAAKMHEGFGRMTPGRFSQQAGNTGPKFLELKLINNRARYMGIYADTFRDAIEDAYG